MSRHATFENFGMAFLTLFQVSTGDNWNGIMKVRSDFTLIIIFEKKNRTSLWFCLEVFVFAECVIYEAGYGSHPVIPHQKKICFWC